MILYLSPTMESNKYVNMYKFINGDLYHFEFSIESISGEIMDGWVRTSYPIKNLIRLDSEKIKKLHSRNLKEYFRIIKDEFYNDILNEEI